MTDRTDLHRVAPHSFKLLSDWARMRINMFIVLLYKQGAPPCQDPGSVKERHAGFMLCVEEGQLLKVQA